VRNAAPLVFCSVQVVPPSTVLKMRLPIRVSAVGPVAIQATESETGATATARSASRSGCDEVQVAPPSRLRATSPYSPASQTTDGLTAATAQGLRLVATELQVTPPSPDLSSAGRGSRPVAQSVSPTAESDVIRVVVWDEPGARCVQLVPPSTVCQIAPPTPTAQARSSDRAATARLPMLVFKVGRQVAPPSTVHRRLPSRLAAQVTSGDTTARSAMPLPARVRN
jgi:hypothetical protein